MKGKKIIVFILTVFLTFLLVSCKTHQHTFSEVYSSDESYHWYAATCDHADEVSGKAEHNFIDGNVLKAATCTEAGSKEVICEDCGYSKVVTVEALGHQYGEVEYTWSADYMKCTATRVCSNDETHVETETADAEYSHKDASATENGYDRYVVDFENSAFEEQVYEKNIPAISHVHNYGELVAEVAATCETAGKEAHYVCSGCSKYFQLVEEEYVEVSEADLVIPAGHNYGELVAEVAAKCETAGKEAHYVCSGCNKYFQLVEEEYVEVSEADLVIPALEHNYELTKDEINHWEECSCCHDKKNEEAHKGGTATTTEKAVCEVCGEKYGELLIPEESKITVYFQNNWWWTNIKIYVYDENDTYVSAWPGSAMELVGTFDVDQWKENKPAYELYAFTFDANKYTGFVINGLNGGNLDQTPDILVSDCLSYSATDCFYMLWDNGNKVGHCTMISEKLHIHDYSELKANAEKHWHECSCGLKQGEEVAHSWDNGVETAPTCTSKGQLVYTCEECDYEKVEELPMSKHAYGELVALVPATCEADGKEAHYVCSECKKFFQLDGEEYVEVTEADLVIPAGHSWVAATCDAPKTCENCGETEGEVLGHQYGEVKYTWSLDHMKCTATRVCSNDETHVETETVDAEYSHKDASETENGYDKYVAKFENSVFEEQVFEEIIPAIGHVHNYGELVALVAATCEEDGKEAHYVCSGCKKFFQLNGEEYVEVTEADLVISATGHSYGELVAEVAAKCEEDGKKAHYVCSECDKFFQLVEEKYVEVTEADLVIPSLKHDYKLTNDENNHWEECSRCNDKKNEEAHKGGTASTTLQAICEVCGEKYGELLKPEENMVTVYFQNNWGWTNINIYVYGENSTYVSAWPGDTMELVGTYDNQELYAFEFDANKYTGFIINGLNNGNKDQTPDILLSECLSYLATDCFYMLWDNGNKVGHCEMLDKALHLHEFGGSDICSGCGYNKNNVNMVKIYLQNNWYWQNINIYVYNESGYMTAWPGDAMVNEGKIDNKDVYTFEFDANKYTHFIISGYDPGKGSDNQTCDLAVSDYISLFTTQCFYMEWDGTIQAVVLKGFSR